jgi:hypothetical protein
MRDSSLAKSILILLTHCPKLPGTSAVPLLHVGDHNGQTARSQTRVAASKLIVSCLHYSSIALFSLCMLLYCLIGWIC